METWLVTDRWWTNRPIVRAFCACGWDTPDMVTNKRAVDELNYHTEKEHQRCLGETRA
jgi:hypothetical protein